MKVDLHNHTTLCNHATGTLEEYLLEAIKKNTKVFGFSDHAPMNFDTKYRMNFTQMLWYESEVKRLQKQYQGTIEVRLGYEVDFLEGHMDKRVLNADVDYLIGSIHFLNGWGFDNPEFLDGYKTQDIDEIWKLYFLQVVKMAESGYFDIVGHLDLIKVFKFYPKKPVLSYAHKALEAIKENGMVLELNTAGYDKAVKEPYPSLELLKLANKLEIPITFGSDAHKPSSVAKYTKKIEAFAREANYSRCVSFRKKEREFLDF